MAKQRDNVKAGLFVVAGILLALVVVFALSDFESLFEKRKSVEISFALSDGLLGLKKGASITLGDQPVGAVTGIRDTLDANKRVVAKVITTSIPRRYDIYEDAVIELVAPPLGSGTKLNIRSVGQTKIYDIASSEPIRGNRSASVLTRDLMADAGIGDAQRAQVREIIANFADVSAALSGNELRPRPDARPGDTHAAALRESIVKLRATIAKFEPLLDNVNGKVDSTGPILEDVKALTGAVREKTPPLLDKATAVADKANSAVGQVDDFLKEKTPALKTTVDNVRDISQQAKDKTMAQVTELLNKADASVNNVKKSTEELQAFVVGQRPVLEHMVANFKLSSDQIKLAMIEIRRSPWRLLYSPGDDEIANDNVYDAARSFALAASTLDSASASLAEVVAKNPDDKEQIRKMVEHMDELFKRFKDAEDSFWKALKEAPGPGTPKK